MDNKPVVTIITSAYNAEKTIGETIDSVICQYYTNFEYIIINHGSSDNTFKIVKNYEKTDQRIRIHSIENNSPFIGQALNYAMKFARGKYITFLDADDLYDNNYLNTMLSHIISTDRDIVVCGFKRFDESGKTIRADTITHDMAVSNENEYKCFWEEMLEYSFGYCYVWWNKLYKVSYLKRIGVQFPEDMKVHADAVFNGKILLNMPKIYCCAASLVNWRCVKGSVSFGTYQKGYYLEALKSAEIFIQLSEKFISDSELLKSFYKKIILSVSHLQRIKHYNAPLNDKILELSQWVTHPMYINMVTKGEMQNFVKEFILEMTDNRQLADAQIPMLDASCDCKKIYLEAIHLIQEYYFKEGGIF